MHENLLVHRALRTIGVGHGMSYTERPDVAIKMDTATGMDVGPTELTRE